MRYIALLLVLAFSALAAPWDGTRGSLTVLTIGQDVHLFVPNAPDRFLTWITVRSSDAAVNNVRVSIRYRDASGALKRDTREADLSIDGAYMTVVFPLRPDQIEGEPYIEARIVTKAATFGSTQ